MNRTIPLRITDDGLVRPAAVAGAFYPAHPAELEATIDHQLADVDDIAIATASRAPRPKAVIVPHAGYIYSGPIAAQAFARLAPWRDEFERVVLLGPAHRVRVHSMALSSADRWVTPLGHVTLDTEARDRLLDRKDVIVDDTAHADEHALEVEVPFLQRTLGSFTLLPIVVGGARDEDTAAVLAAEWGGPETLIVISTDLSHYLDQRTARVRDRRTADHILAERVDEIGPHDACGAFPLRGLLTIAHDRGLQIDLLDLRNSGDTAGATDRVVGYGAFVLTEQPTIAATAPLFDATAARDLIAVAVEAIRARLERRDVDAAEETEDPADDPLAPLGASFVTLRDGDRLLGCIGSLEAGRPLREDVAHNAVAAAFNDPRLPALTADEFARMNVHVSVLSPTEAIAVASLAELKATLVPGHDGVVIEAGRHRATFLPAVWEQIPDVDDFLDHLWTKAGLRRRTWPRNLQVERYHVTDFEDHGPRPPIAS